MKSHLHHLTHLNTDRNPRVWTSLTTNQAPHKPLLLLSIMDLFAQGAITENLIEPSYELVDLFNTYWARLPLGRTGNMAYPFPRLKTDGFWHLIPNPGYEDRIE